MPVAKYFVFVGSALAALLLIVSWYCPAPPTIATDRPQIIVRAAIRIKSERKWPEKIEFDTSLPTIVPPAGEALSVAAQPASLPLEETTGKSRLEAFARLPPDTGLTATQHQAEKAKRRLARASRSIGVAKIPVAGRLARGDAGETCCRSAWVGSGQGSPNAMSRRYAAPLWPTGWLALSQR